MNLDYTGSNLGSLCKIEIIAHEDVDVEPRVVNGVAQGDITPKSGKAWEEVYFTEDTIHPVERPVIINGDEFWQLKVKWSAPKDSPASLALLLTMRRKRYLAKLTQTNGTLVLAGSVAEPCKIGHSMRDGGQSAQDSNHYIVELDLTRAEPAAIIGI